MKKTINFQHKYYKLNQESFTTIRGTSWIKEIKIGQIIKITLKRKPFCDAQIKNIEQKRISDIPIEFLKKDAEYKGLIINSHQEFVNLINSFTPDYYHKADLDSKATIIYLTKNETPNLLNYLTN